MDKLTSAGRTVFAVGIIAFGILSFVFRDYVSGLQPIEHPIPGQTFWIYGTASFLLVAGICLLLDAKTHWAALALAAVFLVWCVSIHLPILIAAPRNGTSWVRLFESLALAGAALVLAAQASPKGRSDRLIKFGRLCFGMSLPVFAATHFIYADFVATLIPAWIPGRLFLAYFTGAAHLFAGLAIVTNIKARLAATLAGAMYGSWALILHVPRVVADIGNQGEITSLFVAIALCGAAWLIAGSVKKAAATAAVESYA